MLALQALNDHLTPKELRSMCEIEHKKVAVAVSGAHIRQ